MFDPRNFNVTYPPQPSEEEILKRVRSTIDKGCIGNLFISNRPSVVLNNQEAITALKEAGADDSVYRKLTKMWNSFSTMGDPRFWWSAAHEELAKILEVDWGQVKSKNREEWI